MKQILITTLCAAVLASAAEIPVAGQNREERALMQLEASVRIVQQQQQELTLAIASLAQALADSTKAMNGRVDALDTRLTEVITKAFADQKLTLTNLGTDVRGISQRSSETITRLLELKEEVEQLRKAVVELATRPVAAPAPVDPLNPDAPAPGVSQAPPAGAAAPSTLGQSASRLHAEAEADHFAGNFESAIRTWTGVLRDFSDSEWADDAQIGIGDAEYARKRYEEAAAAYNAAVKSFPKSDRLGYAYQRLGMAHEALGRFDSARAAYQAAMKQSPGTLEAGLAEQGLARIQRASPGAKP